MFYNYLSNHVNFKTTTNFQMPFGTCIWGNPMCILTLLGGFAPPPSPNRDCWV